MHSCLGAPPRFRLPRRGGLLWSSLRAVESVKVMRVAAVVMFVLVGLMPAAAQVAQPAAEQAEIETVLREAGLFGAWAVDCDAPPSLDNPRVSILLADGGSVIERHELGPDYEVNNYRVIAAKRLSPTRVSVEVLFKPGSEREQDQQLVFSVENDTRRTMYNRIVGGPVVVRDGIVSGHKVKTPTLRRCG